MACVCTCTLASERLVFDARRSLVLTQGQWLFSNSFSSSSSWSGLNVVRFLRNFGWSEPSKLPVSSLPSTSETIRNNFVKIPLQLRSCTFDVRGSVHHSTIHKEKSNKMQQCIKILLFHIYMKLNMFRATHRPSSGTLCLTTSTSQTSNNLPRMKNQRLPVQFQALDDGRCVARNMLSFI